MFWVRILNIFIESQSLISTKLINNPYLNILCLLQQKKRKKIFLKIKVKKFILANDNPKSADQRRFRMDQYACAKQLIRLILLLWLKQGKASHVFVSRWITLVPNKKFFFPRQKLKAFAQNWIHFLLENFTLESE